MPSVAVSGSAAPYDRDPDVCPVCHHAVAPRQLSPTYPAASSGHHYALQITYQCVHSRCERQFIATFERPAVGQPFRLRQTAPTTPSKPEVSEEVAAVSPQFVRIYEQSAAAEALELSEIAGVGYRKALEYLIKDYCVQQNPDSEDAIKKQFLGAVIENYVDSANLKACAKRAAWLGNDETHYVRRWAGKDITDLKVLIQLTMGWIRDHLLTKKYMADMA